MWEKTPEKYRLRILFTRRSYAPTGAGRLDDDDDSVDTTWYHNLDFAYIPILDPVHSEKRIRFFRSHYAGGTVHSGHFGFAVEGIWAWENHVINCFRNAPYSKCFPSTLKRQGVVFKFLQCEERFHDGLVWTIGLKVELKMRFQISPA